jgi:4-hydroxy-3-methylbut-2-enyl diphosphate reductase
VEGPEKLISEEEILHFDMQQHEEQSTKSWLPSKKPLRLLITSGASCPDAIVESVISRLCGFVKGSRYPEELIEQFNLIC